MNTEMSTDNKIRRRRECGICHARFTTYEVIAENLAEAGGYEAGFHAGRESIIDHILEEEANENGNSFTQHSLSRLRRKHSPGTDPG
jgi:hypothetical protein